MDDLQISPAETKAHLESDGEVLLVDVREPNEVALERYPQAVVVPLSSFDPALVFSSNVPK